MCRHTLPRLRPERYRTWCRRGPLGSCSKQFEPNVSRSTLGHAGWICPSCPSGQSGRLSSRQGLSFAFPWVCFVELQNGHAGAGSTNGVEYLIAALGFWGPPMESSTPARTSPTCPRRGGNGPKAAHQQGIKVGIVIGG